jgi:anti-sigma B factor antagonist
VPLKVEQYTSVCVISVQGDLVGDNTKVLAQTVEEQITRNHVVEFIIDLAACETADSVGLEMLLSIKRRSEELFGRISLIAPHENLTRILEITRLHHLFTIHADVPGALKSMR